MPKDNNIVVDDILEITKYYGQKLGNLCKSFTTILEIPGVLFKIITDNFDKNVLLSKDICDNHLENEFFEFIKASYLKTKLPDFSIPGYVKGPDNKYYKYNYKCNDYYYCHHNTVITPNGIKRHNPKDYLLFDCFIIDFNKYIAYPYTKDIDHPYKDVIANAFVFYPIPPTCGEKHLSLNTGVTVVINNENKIIKVVPKLKEEKSR